jgi:ABC-type transport system involved in multi-copper enzyme maturation permease subunit
MSWRKLRLVAQFELAEALRSRLIIVVLAVYGAGAGVGALAFSRALEAGERAARSSLEQMPGAPEVPPDVLRRQALPELLSHFVEDPELRAELVRVDPLALFYAFMSGQLVAPLVLVLAGGAHTSDLARGTTRFVLTRCDRLSWALGKLLGHAALLALGLWVGALVTAGVGLSEGAFDLASLAWLLRASLRTWVYGLAFLGIFVGVALAARAPARARTLSVLTLIGLWIGHSLCSSEWFLERVPPARLFVWCFPAQYSRWLWSPHLALSFGASLALFGIGAVAFGAGHALFRRRDA